MASRSLRAQRIARAFASAAPTAAPIAQPSRPGSAAPIVKWVGGKTKLLPELTARMPERFGRYYEPFAGGAALFFRVAPRRAVLADSNPDLIGLYTAIASDVGAVIRRLEYHRDAPRRDALLRRRATRWNDRDVSWSAAGSRGRRSST